MAPLQDGLKESSLFMTLLQPAWNQTAEVSIWVLTSPVTLGKVKVKVTQSCPTPSDPMDCSLPGPFVHGIFQARVLEWVAIAQLEAGCAETDLGGPEQLLAQGDEAPQAGAQSSCICLHSGRGWSGQLERRGRRAQRG